MSKQSEIIGIWIDEYASVSQRQCVENVMSRKIVIDKCEDCPSVSHKGAFGKIAYIPYCTRTGKELPYTTLEHGMRIYAKGAFEIPTWCPLPENEQGASA